ncbi:cyclodeaminase [Alphaproteobacteria bacterium LSUCC0684]
MRDVLIISEEQLRRKISLDRKMVDLIEGAFEQLAAGKVIQPPILSMALPEVNGEVDVKTAYIPGLDGFAIKISPGFFNNPSLGLPSLNGLVVYFAADTGLVKAVILDNGYLTDIRTAAAGAVAARHLAPSSVTTAGVIGTGVQARLQARAAFLERPFVHLLIHGRSRERAETCASDLADDFKDKGVKVKVVDEAEELVRESQFVITTTPSSSPLIKAEWLHPGLHITAMGSDQHEKNELDPMILGQVDCYCCDVIAQARLLGELRPALEAGICDESIAVELGAVIAGDAPGRKDDASITVADLTGTGAQDTAIATHAFRLFNG